MFQLEILTIDVISGILYFREIILEDISDTTPSHPLDNRYMRS